MSIEMKKLCSSIHATGLILLYLICLAFAGDDGKSPVEIIELKVPTSIQNGTENYATLDCAYKLEDNNTMDLVVTWHLNSSEPIYQWIYGKEPQALGILRDRLDLSYNASKFDFEIHRALRILQPTTELSGDYTCRVSTINGFASKQARMIVYVAATEMTFTIGPSSTPTSINISCSAFGVFPEPRLLLSYGQNGENRLDKVETVSFVDANGAFDISVHKAIPEANLTYPMYFNCDLKIPNTSYFTRKHFIHRRGPSKLLDSDSEEGGSDGSSWKTSSWHVGLALLFVGLIWTV